MLQFIFANLLMVSLGTILFLFARTIPRLTDGPAEKSPSVLERFVTSDLPHRIDRVANVWTGKAFRKLKILSLRFDNYLTEKLKKINTGDGAASGLTGQTKPKIDLGEMLEVRTPEYTGPDRRKSPEDRV